MPTADMVASSFAITYSLRANLDCFVAELVIGPATFGPDPLAPRDDDGS
jgi:hypothetical protein